MRKVVILALFFLSLPNFLQARPREGFHTGPFLLLEGGILNLDWDVNQRTKVEEGKKIEPVFALNSGWHVVDWLAPELKIRYTTSRNGTRREHIGGVQLGVSVTPLFEKLLGTEWLLLPFARPALALQFAGLPGDPNAVDKAIFTKGVGPAFGFGLRVLYHEYLYFGLELEEEFLFHEAQAQLLNDGTSAEIYRGGWKLQFSTFATVGVHY